MKFGILVNEGPYQHQASDSAYQFTKAALEKGHEIFRVFSTMMGFIMHRAYWCHRKMTVILLTVGPHYLKNIS